MKYLLIIAVLIVFVLSAISHEADLSRNFRKTGDAKSWFFPIRAEDAPKY
jgi:hypothetical protein